MVRTEVRSEITGSVWKILVAVGDAVARDQDLILLESMKMEIPVASPVNGRVVSIVSEEGLSILEGQVVAVIGSD
jgi:acetyl-CoA carboxylase biotin carboxyl carrier protein